MAPVARGASSAQRINPVGGVIGRRQRNSNEPSDPWEVAEGRPSILEPDPEPMHEPGPGVIGIDR